MVQLKPLLPASVIAFAGWLIRSETVWGHPEEVHAAADRSTVGAMGVLAVAIVTVIALWWANQGDRHPAHDETGESMSCGTHAHADPSTTSRATRRTYLADRLISPGVVDRANRSSRV